MERIVVENRLVEEAHRVVAARVRPGDVVVDATAGNGNDSVFLAGLVGREGRVHCFDVQEEACRETERRLSEVGVPSEVHCLGHEEMASRVMPGAGAVMFNLGYLPGSDHEVITQPESTLAGIEGAAGILRAGGIATVLCYTGHPGGAAEGEVVLNFCNGLDAEDFAVTRYDSGREGEDVPFLVVIEKVDKGDRGV